MYYSYWGNKLKLNLRITRKLHKFTSSNVFHIKCKINIQIDKHIETYKSTYLFTYLAVWNEQKHDSLFQDPAYLYLTQLTPKQDLFLRHKLSQQQAFVFVYFMRQSLSKRSAKLTEIIE